MQPALSLIQ